MEKLNDPSRLFPYGRKSAFMAVEFDPAGSRSHSRSPFSMVIPFIGPAAHGSAPFRRLSLRYPKASTVAWQGIAISKEEIPAWPDTVRRLPKTLQNTPGLDVKQR